MANKIEFYPERNVLVCNGKEVLIDHADCTMLLALVNRILRKAIANTQVIYCSECQALQVKNEGDNCKLCKTPKKSNNLD